MRVIRDAVWGDIELTRPEVRVLDSFEMQRLRRVRQLGAASLVYPSTTHSRFEHALGTLHVAARILGTLGLPAVEDRIVRLVALVHDVTHVPFGHTLEDERGLFPRHDQPDRLRRVLSGGELGEALRATGLADRVIAAATGEGSPAYLGEIVTGTAGADLLDYVARDSRAAGLGPTWDERVLRYIGLEEDPADGGHVVYSVAKDGHIRQDALSEVIHLMRLRYRLMERVYLHHTKVAAGALVARAVEEARSHGFEIEDLMELGDETLLSELPFRYDEVPVVGRLLDRYRRRRIPRRARVWGASEVSPEDRRAVVETVRGPARATLEDEIADEVGLEPGDVLLVCPPLDVHAKAADVPVDLGDGPVPLDELGHPEVDALTDRYRDLWRLTALVPRDGPDVADRVASAVAGRLGLAPASQENP